MTSTVAEQPIRFTTASPSGSRPMIGQSHTRPMEILLVEDGLMDARITIHSLRRTGIHHRLTLVRTIEEAILFVRRTGIFARAPELDLLLLDMMLPDGTGIDVLEEIFDQADGKPRITTVVLTAFDEADTRNKCDEMGVHDYIAKPVSEDEFLRVVREHKQAMIDQQRPVDGIVPPPHLATAEA